MFVGNPGKAFGVKLATFPTPVLPDIEELLLLPELTPGLDNGAN